MRITSYGYVSMTKDSRQPPGSPMTNIATDPRRKELTHNCAGRFAARRSSFLGTIMMKRWYATITYQTEKGPLSVEHSLEELEELHWLGEHGPDRETIESITI